MRIDSAIRRAAMAFPAARAVETSTRSTTWGQLADRVARLAGGLVAREVRAEDRVAILSLNCDRYLEVLYGVPWMGGIVVPVNTRLAAPEIVHWLRDSGATVLVADRAHVEIIESLLDQLPQLTLLLAFDHTDDPRWELYEELIAGAAPVPAAGGRDSEPAVIFYTGGTTGRSKGVTLSHRNVLACAMQALVELRWDRTSVYMHAAPMFHMADGLGTYAALLAGATQTMVPSFQADEVLQAIERHRVTCSVLVPTHIDLLASSPQAEDYDLSSVTCLAFGGSPMPEAVARRALEAFPNTALFQFYGQSEASPNLTVLRPEYHVWEGPLSGKTRSAGVPTVGCEVGIVGTDDSFLPAGVVGEIVGRGDNVMLGYWNQPDVTADTLRNGWLHTGDAGYIDEEGFLFVVDRVKDMVVTGGENVYCAEVENALMDHPDVLEAQVIGIPSPVWGEAVHGIVRLRPGADPTPAELIQHCRTRIANYKCPKSVEIREDEFPRSGAGKYLKRLLREPYWAALERKVN
jgi:long-chain acyl-CoA synthetase